MVYLIVGGEVAFWVVLVAGLVARYLLRWPRASLVLLLSVPLIDVALFVATAVDLHRGATADWSHGLAAAYIGFSIAFGHSMIRWADQRFAHRFAGGPSPWKPPKYGRERLRYEWREFGKGLLGWAVACGMLLAAIAWIDEPERTAELWPWIYRLSAAIAVWFIFWPLAETLFPSRDRSSANRT